MSQFPLSIDDVDREDRRREPRDDPARQAHHDAIYTLARVSEMKDADTGGHVLRIRSIVEALALDMGLDPEDAESLGYDAMLHDVGKLALPDHILKKPSELNDEERRLMESHTIRGEQMLAEQATMQRAARIARSHHEAFDGSGYPDGLAGDAIPAEARIAAAADVLDALVSERCYKPAWALDEALQAIDRLSGSQLDPLVVAAMRQCHARGLLARAFPPTPGDS